MAEERLRSCQEEEKLWLAGSSARVARCAHLFIEEQANGHDVSMMAVGRDMRVCATPAVDGRKHAIMCSKPLMWWPANVGKGVFELPLGIRGNGPKDVLMHESSLCHA